MLKRAINNNNKIIVLNILLGTGCKQPTLRIIIVIATWP
jgi:hypothetical protein